MGSHGDSSDVEQYYKERHAEGCLSLREYHQICEEELLDYYCFYHYEFYEYLYGTYDYECGREHWNHDCVDHEAVDPFSPGYVTGEAIRNTFEQSTDASSDLFSAMNLKPLAEVKNRK